ALDDPNRPADPDHPSNQARKRYADIRGYDSFEAMLASSGAEGAVPTKVPSSASASDSDSIPDVDMYDFGDNPPLVDDSDDEDYVEGTGDKDKELDEEMVDVEPQPLRRSTQEVRPTLRLGENGWPSGRLGGAAGTRLSARKDMPTATASEDVTMDDASQATSSKSYVTGDETPNTTGVNGGLPSLALGTPASSISENAVRVGLSESATGTNDGASKSVASPDSMRDPGGRAAISEPSTRGNSSQRLNEQESAKTDSRKDLQHGENGSRLGHTAMANLAQSAVTAASKSPSLSVEAPQISPALQVADLLNDATTPEKAIEQPLASTRDKPAEARRPLPLGPMPDSRSSGVAVIQPTTRKHPLPHKPTLGPISSQREGVSQQPS
ncbi:uncharacterized protein GLRG_09460, partial [Colletotrichum graminicola M1.001]